MVVAAQPREGEASRAGEACDCEESMRAGSRGVEIRERVTVDPASPPADNHGAQEPAGSR